MMSQAHQVEMTPMLGFGSLRLKRDKQDNIITESLEELIDFYSMSGGNYYEVARAYRQTEEAICTILNKKLKRGDYILTDKMPANNGVVRKNKDLYDDFSRQLKACSVDYFDYYLLHNLGKTAFRNMENIGAFEFLEYLKREGLARYVGFSFHDKADVLEEILSKYSDLIDVVQLQINYLDWDSPVIQSKACYDVACNYGKTVLVMEPLKGGRLIDLPKEAADILKAKLPGETPASLGLRFPASLSNVKYVLSGMNDVEQIRENMAIFQPFRPLNDAEYSVIDEIKAIFRSQNSIECTQCHYCEKVCPKSIPIPELFHLYENDNKNKVGRMYVRITSEANRGKASDCLKCGRCETACSQKLPIRKLLEEISAEYEPKPTVKGETKRFVKKLKRSVGRILGR